MALPIGSGFYTGDIPGRIITKKNVPNVSTDTLSNAIANQKPAEFVKSSPAGVDLAAKLSLHTNNTQTQYTQTIYDQPSPKVSRAISTYTEFANLDRRAEVQSLIGVDIYA
ncbi:hypothetical protein AMS58_04045 [Pseudoalteromonas porphyrae]|uniref:hypothetical protein n=1 Tax=Pseudoalteromonas TaxID=53246 RepID=UPI0006BB0A3C|nr:MULTISPECIES: hypothetical protein [Pseudoalteromonas]KPH95856.1 hypothetical protein AMS58_04045 [Pseudoalteromonas porphyrae]